jgi:hypothetical protein
MPILKGEAYQTTSLHGASWWLGPINETGAFAGAYSE